MSQLRELIRARADRALRDADRLGVSRDDDSAREQLQRDPVLLGSYLRRLAQELYQALAEDEVVTAVERRRG